jgi:hypothetical protein
MFVTSHRRVAISDGEKTGLSPSSPDCVSDSSPVPETFQELINKLLKSRIEGSVRRSRTTLTPST